MNLQLLESAKREKVKKKRKLKKIDLYIFLRFNF